MIQVQNKAAVMETYKSLKGLPALINLPNHFCNTAVTRFGRNNAFHTWCLPTFQPRPAYEAAWVPSSTSHLRGLQLSSHIRSIGRMCGCSRRNALGLFLRSFPAACPSQNSQEIVHASPLQTPSILLATRSSKLSSGSSSSM